MDESLSAAFITPSNLIKSSGESLFVNPREGNITITAEQPVNNNNAAAAAGRERADDQDDTRKHHEQQQQQPISLHAALALFGELSTFSINESIGLTTYFASYYDAREAANAAKYLHGRSILGMQIRVVEGFPLDVRPSDNQGPMLPHERRQEQQETMESGGGGDGMEANDPRHAPSSLRSPATTPEKKLFNPQSNKLENFSTPPSPLRTQSNSNNNSSDSDDVAGTPHAPTTSPMSKLPAISLPPSSSSSNMNARPRSRQTPTRTPPNGKPANANVPIYSTPPGPSPRLRTTSSSGNLVMMMRSTSPNALSQPQMALSPQQMVNRGPAPAPVPPRLSLPWLQGSMSGPGGALHYEGGGGGGNGSGLLRQHPPTLGPGAYIRGLDNPVQPVHRGPYAYNAPQGFSPVSGGAHRFPSSNGNGNNTVSGSMHDTSPTSLTHPHHSHPPPHHHHHHHPSPHSRKHTLSTSTSTSTSISTSTSTGTGPSTVDSPGPTTPLHAYGRSPALSTRTSFEVVVVVERKDPGLGVSDPQTRDGPTASVRPPYNGAGGGGGGYHGHAAPERNGVDVGRIEAGLDTRTTVMLKNVPNKMSDADLRKYISDVVPNSFDFVYLRFDFNSSANVGYAFVNFVDVADLLSFAKARLGVKWNMFCSEKVLQMSYANFQGKEALVEKFKNSCVMEMQDEWVPKIFHSSGPNKGQREPFPPATNPSRARRSQDQRERGLLRGSGLFVGGRGHMGFKHGQ